MKKNAVSLALTGALLALASQTAMAAPDWSKVPKADIYVFHPGVTPIEWVSGKGEHSGASGLKKGEACAGCHVEDGKLSLDLKRENLGFLRLNYENFRTWDNAAGGYYPPTGVQYQHFDDDLAHALA